jgi:hypothetical protein
MNKLLNMVKIQNVLHSKFIINHDICRKISMGGELAPLARWVSSVAGHVDTSAVGLETMCPFNLLEL